MTALLKERRMSESNFESELAAVSRLLENGDPIAAAEAYKVLVDKGAGWAALQLGYMFENSKGVRQSAEVAERWYKKSRDLGCLQGWYYLACLYETTRRQELAFREMELAAQTGFLPAINRLGLYYERGVGCAPNFETAKHYRDFAAAQGHLYAKRWQGIQLIKQRTPSSLLRGLIIYLTQSWRILKLGLASPADPSVQV
jgi:TPR repeat protein